MPADNQGLMKPDLHKQKSTLEKILKDDAHQKCADFTKSRCKCISSRGLQISRVVILIIVGLVYLPN